MAKNKIYYLLLGIGLGVIFTSSVNIAFNKPKKVEYSEQEIIQKARELGMVTVKESIEANSKKNDDTDNAKNKENIEVEDSKATDENIDEEDEEDNRQVQESGLNINEFKTNKPKVQIEKLLKEEQTYQSKEGYQIVKIIHGDTAITIADKLKTAGIINDAEEFLRLVVKKNLQRKFIKGNYQIKINEDYDELLKILTSLQI